MFYFILKFIKSFIPVYEDPEFRYVHFEKEKYQFRKYKRGEFYRGILSTSHKYHYSYQITILRKYQRAFIKSKDRIQNVIFKIYNRFIRFLYDKGILIIKKIQCAFLWQSQQRINTSRFKISSPSAS